jgi:endonuclease/exonuclease/phosphatase family metal-dependent hydrolase
MRQMHCVDTKRRAPYIATKTTQGETTMRVRGAWATAAGAVIVILGLGKFAVACSLSLNELQRMSADPLSASLIAKGRESIEEVIVKNQGRPNAPGTRPVSLWVTEFNIERGLAFSELETLLTDCRKFQDRHMLPRAATSATCRITESDLLLLVETDDGVCRTGYRSVAEELATAMGFHFAYASEFIEVDPRVTGLSSNPVAGCETISPGKARNRHGDAILSRYPIKSAKRVELPSCYDWYELERSSVAATALGLRQLRLGERMALIADIELPGRQIVTVVNTHLENKTNGVCRTQQMKRILDEVKDRRNPVILGGDWNTTGYDGSTWNPFVIRTQETLFDLLQSSGFDVTSPNDEKPTMSGRVAGSVLPRVDFLAGRGFCGKATIARTHIEIQSTRTAISDHLPITAEFPLVCP